MKWIAVLLIGLPLMAGETGLKKAPQDSTAAAYSSTLIQDASAKSFKELGLTLGSPGKLNLNLGYWGSDDFPLVARFSAGYFGEKNRGMQFDLGWKFHQTASGNFRQFLAATFTAWRLRTSSGFIVSSTHDSKWIGAGPSYGFNLYGFSLQIGSSFGSGETFHDSGSGLFGGSYTSQDSYQTTMQLGYTFMW